MKRSEAVDFAFSAGFELVNSSIHVDGEDITDEIVLLINIIEQATLDRAAKYFDGRGKDKHGNWSTGSYDADSPGIILRALKDSHE